MSEGRMRTPRRQAIWDLTNGRCFYCGCGLIADDDRRPLIRTARHDPPDLQMEVDHKLSPRRGGSDDPANAVPSCGNCNVRKSQKTIDEYRIWLMIVDGRPPMPFFGEAQKVERDWLIVVSPRLKHEVLPTLLERVDTFSGVIAGGGP